MNSNIIRQIRDVQAQAERLISRKAEVHELEDFSRYNEEIKNFLKQNITDEFILKYVKEIPSLDFDKIEVQENIVTIAIGIFSGGLTSQYRQNQKREEAMNIVRDIRGKYASAEFMLKNYFTE